MVQGIKHRSVKTILQAPMERANKFSKTFSKAMPNQILKHMKQRHMILKEFTPIKVNYYLLSFRRILFRSLVFSQFKWREKRKMSKWNLIISRFKTYIYNYIIYVSSISKVTWKFFSTNATKLFKVNSWN